MTDYKLNVLQHGNNLVSSIPLTFRSSKCWKIRNHGTSSDTFTNELDVLNCAYQNLSNNNVKQFQKDAKWLYPLL